MSVPLIDPREVHEKIAAGTPVRVLDVRTRGEYGAERVEPSELMPLDQLDTETIGTSNGQNGQAVYVLCRTGRRASEAAEKLAAAGVSNVHVIEGGIEGWRSAALPVVKGKGVISLERQVRIGAGALVVAGVLLGLLVHPGFHALAVFVGGGLVFAGITDWCGMAKLLAKMPWNR